MRLLTASLFSLLIASPALADEPERRPELEAFLSQQQNEGEAGEESAGFDDKTGADDHRYVRLGIRGFGVLPAAQDNADIRLGASLGVPLTFNFYRGIGMRLAFHGSYNRATELGLAYRENLYYNENEPLDQQSDVRYYEPNSPACDPSFDGCDDIEVRRFAHLATYTLDISFNYEVTAPNIKFFRHMQPFVGGGVVIAWLYNYPDLLVQDQPVFNNDDNDLDNPNNVDPWSTQVEPGWRLYGGFHVNLGPVARLTIELSYMSVDLDEAPLRKATEGYDARHLAYSRRDLLFGGGFDWRF